MKRDVARGAAAVWDFVAGDSRRTPIALVLAVAAALALERARLPGIWPALAYAGIVAAGLVAAAFESAA